jgi:hypothetical protein
VFGLRIVIVDIAEADIVEVDIAEVDIAEAETVEYFVEIYFRIVVADSTDDSYHPHDIDFVGYLDN